MQGQSVLFLLVSVLHLELEIPFPSSLVPRINPNFPPPCQQFLVVVHILLPLHSPFSAFQVVSCIFRSFSLRQTSTGLKAKASTQNSARPSPARNQTRQPSLAEQPFLSPTNSDRRIAHFLDRCRLISFLSSVSCRRWYTVGITILSAL